MYNALIKLYVNGPHSSREQTFYFFSKFLNLKPFQYTGTCILQLAKIIIYYLKLGNT